VIRRRVVATTALSTIAVAGLVAAGIAHAMSASTDNSGFSGDSAARTSLILTVIPANGARKTVALECDPTGGDHPHGPKACDDLNAAGGDLTKIKAKAGQMCPHLVLQVRVLAFGTYRGTPVNYDHTWNNDCELVRATGEVFTF
jgi:hypothetical protein